eukprot:7572058-Heterocapsa_arctica.AAC.1
MPSCSRACIRGHHRGKARSHRQGPPSGKRRSPRQRASLGRAYPHLQRAPGRRGPRGPQLSLRAA